MGIVPGGRVYGVGEAVANYVIHKKITGNHCRLHCNTPNTFCVCWGRVDSGVQLKPEVVVSGPQTVEGGKWSRV